jgi:hypothetical protein
MKAPAAAAPVRRLAALTVAVLAAHALLLQTAPRALAPDAPAPARALATRTLVLDPPQPTPPPAGPRARPRPPPSTPPRPANPVVAPPSAAPVQAAEPSASPAAPVGPAAAAPLPPVPAPAPQAAAPAAPALTLAIPGSVRLRYSITGEVKRLPYSARAELLWQHDGSAYDARYEVGAFLMGSRTQTSAGRITPEGLAPTRFADKSRSEVAAHFERDKGKVVFSANTPDAPLLAGAQDQLSILLQLGAMLAGDPARYPPGTNLTIQTIGPREADAWLFTVGAEETLSLPAGEIRALKLTRNPRHDYDRRMELWLAPAIGYLPARVRLTQSNGDVVDQQLLATP